MKRKLQGISQEIKNQILAYNLPSPPDVTSGVISQLGLEIFSDLREDLGRDIAELLKNNRVTDSGNLVNIGNQLRDIILSKKLTPDRDLLRDLRNAGVDLYDTFNDQGKEIILIDNKSNDPGNVDDIAKDEVKRHLDRNTLNNENREEVGESLNLSNNKATDNGDLVKYNDSFKTENLRRNKVLDPNDPSDYNSSFFSDEIRDTLGKLVLLNDYSVPNLTSISNTSLMTSEQQAALLLQLNNRIPEQINKFEQNVVSKLFANRKSGPYVNGTILADYEPNTYVPSDFLDRDISDSALLTLLNTYSQGDIQKIIDGGDLPFPNDTVMGNIAALTYKFQFESRIKQVIERATIGRTNLDEAMTNPATAINILKDPTNNLFEKDYEITVPANTLGKVGDYIGRLIGVTSPVNLVESPFDTNLITCFPSLTENNAPKTELEAIVQDLTGSPQKKDYSTWMLANTGTGQKFQLFTNVSYNKYRPNYEPVYTSELANQFDEFLQRNSGVTGFLGLSSGPRPEGNSYLNEFLPSNRVLSDLQGDIVKSEYELIRLLTQNGIKYELDLIDAEDFIWYGNSYETYRDQDGLKDYIPNSDLFLSKYNRDRYRECSILFKTQNLIDKAANNGLALMIDQTKSKFFDGKYVYSKGNAVLRPIKNEVRDETGKLIGYNYEVPGLSQIIDPNGNKKAVGERDTNQIISEGLFCRTWTKANKFSRINNLVRYKGLLRKERGSVIEDNANYSIVPTPLNSNTKKYMFSIENLAYKGSTQYDQLPECEKGKNGGRLMWFPPYDLTFNETSNASWTESSFLGRPESIYTYNNSSRTGSINFKLLVDHPSILNVLVRKELDKLPDTAVDEIIDAFWAGCIEYDIFELAALYNQVTIDELNYFKKLIGSIKGNITNLDANRQTVNARPNVQIPIVNNNTPIVFPLVGYNLFFENDVPLATTDNTSTYKDLYDIYKEQITNHSYDKTINAEYKKGNKGLVNDIKYYDTLGAGGYNVFETGQLGNNPKLNDMAGQYTALETELKNISPGNNITIKVKTYASPLGTQENNRSLVGRRFISIVKWLVKDIFAGLEDSAGIQIDPNSLSYTSVSSSYTFYRISSNGVKDTIKIESIEATAKDAESTYRDINDLTVNDLSTITFNNVSYPVFYVESGGETYMGVLGISDTVNDVKARDILKTNFASISGQTQGIAGPEFIGALNSLGQDRVKADYIVGVTSKEASFARRAEISVEITQNQSPDDVQLVQPTLINNKPPLETNFTKREIAQKLLNSLITECDYFDYLEETSPVYLSKIKDKIKYFTPAFHSMTPEGLNARLTFLQQCLRPGETIKNADGTTCDAKNTAFGRPPVCVLRIGDFYNTKIIIDNISFTPEPLILDLNPEGIGVQPMIVNVSMSVKLLGGSGLKNYVDQLQTALSFDYYANTEIYDPRSFANTDLESRNAINQEVNPLTGQLDLVEITKTIENVFSNAPRIDSNGAKGTIGKLVRKTISKGLNDIYDDNTGEGTEFKEDPIFDLCLIESNYQNSSFDTVELSYKPVYDDMYRAYSKNISALINHYDYTDDDMYPLKSLFNRYYSTDIISGDNVDTSASYFDNEKGYKKTNIIFNELLRDRTGNKLNVNSTDIYPNLYPVYDMFELPKNGVINDLTVVNANNGILDSDYETTPIKYFDDNVKTRYNQLSNLIFDTMTDKLNTDLHAMFLYNTPNNNVYERYFTTFDKKYKNKLRSLLINEFNKYRDNFLSRQNIGINGVNTSAQQFGKALYSLVPVLEGFDAEYQVDNNSLSIYEILPNQKRLSADGKSYFGYSPFHSVLMPNGDVVDFKTLSSGWLSAYTGTTGNVEFLINQLTQNSSEGLPQADFIGNNTSEIYQIPTAYGYVCNDILNSYDNDRFNDYMTEVYGTKKYEPVYTFEKLSMEFFEFSNKMAGFSFSDIVNFDSYNIELGLNKSFNFNTFYVQSSGDTSLKKESLKVVLDTDHDFDDIPYMILTGSTLLAGIDDLSGKLGGYFNYGSFNCDTTNIVGLDNNVKTNIDTLKNNNQSTFISLVPEYLLLGFIKTLLDKQSTIVSEMEAFIDSNKPLRNNVVDQNKIASMKTILGLLFKNLSKFYGDVSSYNKTYSTQYKNAVLSNVKSFTTNVLANQLPNNSVTTVSNPDTTNIEGRIFNALGKGTDNDYTLLLRQSSKPWTRAIQVAVDLTK